MEAKWHSDPPENLCGNPDWNKILQQKPNGLLRVARGHDFTWKSSWLKAQAPLARDNRFGHPTSRKDRMAPSLGRCCGSQVHRSQGEGRTSRGPSLMDCWAQDEPGRDWLPIERDYLPPTEAPAWSIKLTSIRVRIDLPTVQRRHNSVDWCLRQNHVRQDSGKRA